MREALPLDTSVPDAIEPIIGWRAWTLRGWGGELRLAPVVQTQSWRPRRPFRASCHAQSPGKHRAPEWTCTCGVYALSRLGALVSSYGVRGKLAVVGSVALWGTVIVHASGYRAEFAYPDRIRLVCPRCLTERRSGIPDRLFRGRGSLWVPACAEHAPPSGVRSLPAGLVQERLLAVYGVELLPVEALREAGFREDRPVGPPPPVTRDAPRARPSRTAALLRPAMLSVAVLLCFIGLLRSDSEPDRVLASAPSMAAFDPVTAFNPATLAVVRAPRTRSRPSQQGGRPPRLEFALVCAEELPGGIARILRCRNPRAHLLGFAQSPPDPRSTCLADEAYTRKQRFSVCWIGFDPIESRLLRLPGVRWWDLRF